MVAHCYEVDCLNLKSFYKEETMFSITLGFVLPSAFRAYGRLAFLVWLIGLDFMRLRGEVAMKIWLRVCGVSLVLELTSVKVMLGDVEEMPKMSVKETTYTKNKGEITRNTREKDDTKAFSASEEWTMTMLLKGYKYVIPSTHIFDPKDRSFYVPKLDAVDIEIGDKVAFGTEEDWVGVEVVGLRDRGDDILYFIKPLKERADA